MRKLLTFLIALGAIVFAVVSPAFAVFNKLETVTFSNISATPAAFTLGGGTYGLTCHATWGGGNIALQRLSSDGSTYMTVITALTADGYASANLPSGKYQLQITTATGVYCDVTAVVTTLFGGATLAFSGPSGGGGGCTAATNFLARTSGLSGTETTAYTTMICGLVTDGIITGNLSGATGCGSVLDGLYIFATNTTTTANLNLCGTSYGLTQHGSVTFNADHGYTGNGSTGFFDTGFNLVTVGGHQNSVSMGAYVLTNRTSSNTGVALGVDDGTIYCIIEPLNGGVYTWDTNGGSFPSFTNTSARGAWISTRTTASAHATYQNGSATAVQSSSTGTATPPNFNMFISALNNSGTAAQFSADQTAAAFLGGGLTGTQAAAINNRINTYMCSFSQNVYTPC